MRNLRIRRHIPIILILLVLYTNLAGQDFFPEADLLYDNSSLARVDITLDPSDLALILQEGNEQSDTEYMATFKFTRGTHSETVDSVGFRLRGNTSRNSNKKSFKVSLNTFVSGQKFMGVEKINLNGEHNDPSMSRAIISWYIYQQAGVPASRGSHTTLYINDEYRGVYANVEHVDEEFIDLRFGNNDGNLFKCLWPADLTYRGEDQSNYRDFFQNDRQVYELKRNEEENDFTDLAHFISILNNTSPADFPEKLEPYFNVNSYLKNQAVEVLIGHWDGYAYNKNNFYLYHNEGTDKIEFIPYDPDNTLGVDWINRDWAERNIYSWAQNGGNDRPLYKRILENPIYYDRYSFYVDRILKDVFNNEHLDPLLSEMKARISSAAAEDIYRSLDWDYDYDDFNNSFTQAQGDHVKYGIIPYISSRAAEAQDQLESFNIAPIITYVYANEPRFTEDADVKFLVEDDNDLSDVKIFFSSGISFVEENTIELGNGYYSATCEGLSSDGTIKFYIEATDSEMNKSRDPVVGYHKILYGSGIGTTVILSQENQLKIYPNPVTRYLNIDFSASLSEFSYRILDMQGRTVQQKTHQQERRIHINSELQSGVYFIEIKHEGSRSVETKLAKFIISK